MKTLFLPPSVFCLGLIALIFSCKGPEGAQGPKGDTGLQGSAGAQGQAGPKGDAGTANVIYTDWFSPNWSITRPTSNDFIYLNVPRTETARPILTDDAINKSAVYVYTKFKVLDYNSQDSEYRLIERISNQTNITGNAKIPGRTTNNYEDFHPVFCGYNPIGSNFFEPWGQLYNYDNTTQKYFVPQEYLTKTAAEIRTLATDVVKYRIVVIPGTVLSARVKSIDYSNYEEVKAAFGIKD